MSDTINPKVLLANGDKQRVFRIEANGSVHILCADGIMREVNVEAVRAFANGIIAPGVWAMAAHVRANPMMTEGGILVPPSFLRDR